MPFHFTACYIRATDGSSRRRPPEVFMSPYSRRDFLKTGIAAGTIVGVGSLPLHAARPSATDLVTLGKSEPAGHPPGLRHRQQQRPRPVLARAKGIQPPRPLRLRSRHPFLRDRRILHHARHARRSSQALSARELRAHEQGHHRRRRRPARPLRRNAPHLADRVLRHHAAPLAAHR